MEGAVRGLGWRPGEVAAPSPSRCCCCRRGGGWGTLCAMGVMAAVGYMAAETGSETQGGGRCKAGGRGGSRRAGAGPRWGGATVALGAERGVPMTGGRAQGGARAQGRMGRSHDSTAWGQGLLAGGGVATAEAGPEGGAKATEDPSGWGQSLTSRATAEGGALAGPKRRDQKLQGAGPRPGIGPGPEVGGVARCRREGRMRGRPPRGGARGGVWLGAWVGLAGKPGPRGGATPGLGWTALRTCVLLDSGEGRMEGLGHGRALSCGANGGTEWDGGSRSLPITPRNFGAKRRATSAPASPPH